MQEVLDLPQRDLAEAAEVERLRLESETSSTSTLFHIASHEGMQGYFFTWARHVTCLDINIMQHHSSLSR